jgi:4-carboxymuconolactone decarboxylase
MRSSKPRIVPLEEKDWNDEQRQLLAPMAQGGRVPNIFKTLVRHPKLLKRWLPFANHVLFKSGLAPREREMLILRVAWVARAEYEWGHHQEIGQRAGLNDAEIVRIAAGPDAPGWTRFEAALLRAVDELHRSSRIGSATWTTLAEHYDTAQLMDVVFTIGNCAALAMALNSFGVALDEGLRGFPR